MEKKSQKITEEEIENFRKESDMTKKGRELYLKGLKLLKEKKGEEAKGEFKKALRAFINTFNFSKNTNHLNSIAAMHSYLGEHDEALSNLSKAVEMGYVDALPNLAKFYKKKAERTEGGKEKKECYEQALRYLLIAKEIKIPHGFRLSKEEEEEAGKIKEEKKRALYIREKREGDYQRRVEECFKNLRIETKEERKKKENKVLSSNKSYIEKIRGFSKKLKEACERAHRIKHAIEEEDREKEEILEQIYKEKENRERKSCGPSKMDFSKLKPREVETGSREKERDEKKEKSLITGYSFKEEVTKSKFPRDTTGRFMK